jgi:scyllo-inositol 2-dehydrogenase (NADP+)
MFKIAIIGGGRMGITHYSIINSHPDIKITALADTSTLINSLLGRYIPDLRLYKDYNALIDQEKIDAILLCTPPNLHYPVIKKAATKNIHVFVEKPFTTKLDEATELDDLYRKKGLVNQVGYVNRFNDIFKSVKTMIQDDVIGDIIRFKSEMFSCTITRPDKGSGWRATHETGGGAVFEMASHAIDLVNYLVGEPDKVVGSSLNKIYSQNVEDAVSATFLYEHGISGTIYINWSDESYRKPTNKIELFGSEGKIMADQHSLKVYLKKENKSKKLRVGWNTLYITDLFEKVPFYVRGNEFTSQLYHFVDCLKDKSTANICTFKDGVKTLNVIDSIFNDFNQNRI